MEPFRSEEMDWGVGRRHGYIYSHSPIIILLPCAFQLVMLGQGFARCSFSSMARRVGVRTSARDSRPCTPPRDGGFDHLHRGGGHRQIMQCLSFLLGQEERVQGHTGPPKPPPTAVRCLILASRRPNRATPRPGAVARSPRLKSSISRRAHSRCGTSLGGHSAAGPMVSYHHFQRRGN